jgi:hypothetical protein
MGLPPLVDVLLLARRPEAEGAGYLGLSQVRDRVLGGQQVSQKNSSVVASTPTEVTLTREQALTMAADTAIMRMELAEKRLSQVKQAVKDGLETGAHELCLKDLWNRLRDVK